MKFYSIILVIFTISCSKAGWSQTSSFSTLKDKLHYKGVELLTLKKPILINPKITQQTTLLKQTNSIPSSYNYNELGAFCKLEVQIEKKTRIPIKIRLGEVNLVEQKEGNPYTPSPWTGVY